MSEKASESVVEPQELLPPFSFSKKPIKSVYTSSGISSILLHHPNQQNNPQNDESKLSTKPLLNNINYDEQIRAPRMSLASHYTHLPQSPVPGPKHISSEAGPSDSESPPQKPYTPATFDLNAKIRHNLLPLRHNSSLLLLDAYFPGLSLPPVSQKSNSGESARLSRSQTSELTVHLSQLKIQRALLNLNENTTSAERTAPCELATKQRSNGHLVDVIGPSLQHVYSLKKPLCTPAVLRPAQEPELSGHVEYDTSSPECEMKEYPFKMPAHDEPSLETLIEPTREHWKPNHSTDHCTKCFDVFGNFFSPQRKRRHHCRFCGFLYCGDCLFKNAQLLSRSSTSINSPSKRSGSSSSNSSGLSVLSSISASLSSSENASGVMMDAKARLVVPIFANLSQDPISFESMRQRFKSCKICKSCGHNYLRLVQALNLRVERAPEEVTVPYAFIENPFFDFSSKDEAVSGGTLDSSLSSISDINPTHFGPCPSRDRRRSSTGNNVPLDWTWSSF